MVRVADFISEMHVQQWQPKGDETRKLWSWNNWHSCCPSLLKTSQDWTKEPYWDWLLATYRWSDTFRQVEWKQQLYRCHQEAYSDVNPRLTVMWIQGLQWCESRAYSHVNPRLTVMWIQGLQSCKSKAYSHVNPRLTACKSKAYSDVIQGLQWCKSKAYSDVNPRLTVM